VLLVDRVERVGGEVIGETHERGPQAPVHEGDLPAHQAQGDDVGGRAHGVDRVEDRVPPRMTPPAAPDRLAGDEGMPSSMLKAIGLT